MEGPVHTKSLHKRLYYTDKLPTPISEGIASDEDLDDEFKKYLAQKKKKNILNIKSQKGLASDKSITRGGTRGTTSRPSGGRPTGGSSRPSGGTSGGGGGGY